MTLKKPARTLWIVAFVLYFAAIVWLYFATFESDPQLPAAILGIPLDKCVHFLMFLPFPVLGTIAFQKDSWWRTLCWSTVAANIIAFVFESQQHYINPYRYTQAEDLRISISHVVLLILIPLSILIQANKPSTDMPEPMQNNFPAHMDINLFLSHQ